jgi:lipoprotein-anchoring transpeptidase ErfK/SrfK
MSTDPISDIYLMKRRKSRAGCLTMLFATIGVLILIGVVLLFHRAARPKDKPAPEPVAKTKTGTGSAAKKQKATEERKAKPGKKEATAAPAKKTTGKKTGTAATAPSKTKAKTEPAVEEAGEVPADTADDGVADSALKRARSRLKKGDHQAAREAALEALNARPDDPKIEGFLNDLAMPLLASQRPMPEKIEYVVQSGDYLGKLAATYNTPVALIAKANNIQGAIIRVGETLRLFDGTRHAFALNISKSRNDLVVAIDGKFFKRYRVATGRDNKTPVGTFKITDKIMHPTWHRSGGAPVLYGDPANPLGTHWLAIDLPGYGLHGTWEPDQLGAQTSDGCVRLLNDHIEELYTILPKGTLVTITD